MKYLIGLAYPIPPAYVPGAQANSLLSASRPCRASSHQRDGSLNCRSSLYGQYTVLAQSSQPIELQECIAYRRA